MALLNTDRWLTIASNLRIDRSAGPAPHQPLLLLIVAELAEQNKLRQPHFEVTGELTFRFLAFWTIVAARRSQKPEIHLPFFHLKSSGVWTPLDETGQPTLEKRRAVAVQLNVEFFECLQDADFRECLRRVLIAKYFEDSTEGAALYNLV